MKRFLICRNKNTERFIVIKNGEKRRNNRTSKENVGHVSYKNGFITLSNEYNYINIYENADENGNIAIFDNIKLKPGDDCPWDSNYTIVYKYTPSPYGIYEWITVNSKNGITSYHTNINKSADHHGITIFDQVFITDEGIQIGIYRDTLPIILGKPSPILNSVDINSIIYINEKAEKYYYAKYIGDTNFKVYNNRNRNRYLKLPENHIMKEDKMLSGWSDGELIYGKITTENKVEKDTTYDKFQSEKYWDYKVSLTELINNSDKVYLNTNYRKHSSDDCYGKFILYLENRDRDDKNNINYSLLGICKDGFDYIGDSGYLDVNCSGIKEMDIDEAITFMHKYRDLMVSREEFEYELVNNINVEQSCVNILFESSYNSEDKNRFNNMMKINK